jgi:hypothetical protein
MTFLIVQPDLDKMAPECAVFRHHFDTPGRDQSKNQLMTLGQFFKEVKAPTRAYGKFAPSWH